MDKLAGIPNLRLPGEAARPARRRFLKTATIGGTGLLMGVYLPEFGIRSEVNVLITETGGVVTTPIQAEPYRLGE